MTDLAFTVHQYSKGWQPEERDKVWQQELIKSLTA